MAMLANASDGSAAGRAASRAVVALACMLLVTSLMNVVVFPLFDGVFTFARDISQTVQALMFLVVGAVATFKPSLFRLAPLTLVVLLSLLAGAFLLPVSLAAENPALLVFSSSLFAAARGMVMMAVALALSRSLSGRSVSIAVAVAFVASVTLQAFCWIVPIYVGLFLFLALPFVAFMIVRSDAAKVLAIAVDGEAPADAAITRPSSFLPLASQLFVCLFLFRTAFGYSLRFGENTGVPVEVFFMIVPVGVAAILLVCWKRFDADLLTQISVLCVAAGFFFVSSVDAPLREASNLLLSSGNTLFNMVAWIVIVSVGSRNLAGALSVAGWGQGVGSFGTILGATLGVWSNHLFEDNQAALTVVSGVLLVLFVGYAIIGLKRFSFAETVQGVTPVATDVKVESSEEQFAARCQEIADCCKLTPREREVFEMLARGRNREYIQEKLVVSRNTVKAHVKHVYAKLGIHSHQELIDLVESGK